jgi:hypothetical protein
MCVLNGRIHKMKLAKKGDVMFKVGVMLVLNDKEFDFDKQMRMKLFNK